MSFGEFIELPAIVLSMATAGIPIEMSAAPLCCATSVGNMALEMTLALQTSVFLCPLSRYSHTFIKPPLWSATSGV